MVIDIGILKCRFSNLEGGVVVEQSGMRLDVNSYLL